MNRFTANLSHREIVHAAWRVLAVLAALALFAVVNHHGANKVATYRCAHNLPGHCATGVRR